MCVGNGVSVKMVKDTSINKKIKVYFGGREGYFLAQIGVNTDFLIYMAMTYQDFNPYLKGIHLTFGSLQ